MSDDITHPATHPAARPARSPWSACRPSGTGRATSRPSTCRHKGYRVVPVNPRYADDPRRALLRAPRGHPRAGRHRRRLPPHRRRAADRATGDRHRRQVPVAADRREEPRGRRAGARRRARLGDEPLREDRTRAAVRRPALGRRQHARDLGARGRSERGRVRWPTTSSSPRRWRSTPARSPTRPPARARCRSTRRPASSSTAPSTRRACSTCRPSATSTRGCRNPTVAALEERVAALEGGRAAVAARQRHGRRGDGADDDPAGGRPRRRRRRARTAAA